MTAMDIETGLAAINRTAGECLSYLYQVDGSHKRMALCMGRSRDVSASLPLELNAQGKQVAKSIEHIKLLKAQVSGMRHGLLETVIDEDTKPPCPCVELSEIKGMLVDMGSAVGWIKTRAVTVALPCECSMGMVNPRCPHHGGG